MFVLHIIVMALATIVGSLVAATCLCWTCWTLFKLVRHPELGTPLVLILLLSVFGGSMIASEFLRLTLMFSILAAVGLWFVGLEWRRDRRRARAS